MTIRKELNLIMREAGAELVRRESGAPFVAIAREVERRIAEEMVKKRPVINLKEFGLTT